MKTYITSITILLKASDENIKRRLNLDKDAIISEENVKSYFEDHLDHLAGSNDGSELLANATIGDVITIN